MACLAAASRRTRKERHGAPLAGSDSSISTLCSRTYVSCRTGAPFTVMGVSGTGFRRYMHGDCQAISKRTSWALCSCGSLDASGTRCRKVSGWCEGPIGHASPSLILCTMQRCHRGNEERSTPPACTHSKSTSTKPPSASLAESESWHQRPGSSLCAKPPRPKVSDAQTPKSWPQSLPAGLRSSPTCRTRPGLLAPPGGAPLCGMPRTPRTAVSARSQTWNCWSTSSLIACAVATAVCTPRAREAPVLARFVTQAGAAPTSRAWKSSLQKWQQLRDIRS
mmetsp:Transcript_14850/g.46760  ORF Transcript_14850/g.46760 Transcript_14850/m.46760 type:complete len:279 (-) Transcript_14850:632-1468(-)